MDVVGRRKPVFASHFPLRYYLRGTGKLRIHFRDQGVTSQNPLIFVAEVEVVDTSDCHSEDSGFEPRRSRQPEELVGFRWTSIKTDIEKAIHGLIAHLGERLPCKQEVVGSIPTGSTRALQSVGRLLVWK